MPTTKNIVQLRQLLAERFPGLRTSLEKPAETTDAVWPTGVAQIDNALQGGLPKSAITEIVTETNGSGGALILGSLIQRAAENNQFLALIDGQDSFDPGGFDNDVLSRLLWIRCGSAEQALKATDYLLRDRNVSLVALDLQINPAAQLRKIPSSTWYRLQRIVEATSTVFVVFTPRAMVSSAQARLNPGGRFALEAMEEPKSVLFEKLRIELSHHRLHVSPVPEQRTAEAG